MRLLPQHQYKTGTLGTVQDILRKKAIHAIYFYSATIVACIALPFFYAYRMTEEVFFITFIFTPRFYAMMNTGKLIFGMWNGGLLANCVLCGITIILLKRVAANPANATPEQFFWLYAPYWVIICLDILAVILFFFSFSGDALCIISVMHFFDARKHTRIIEGLRSIGKAKAMKEATERKEATRKEFNDRFSMISSLPITVASAQDLLAKLEALRAEAHFLFFTDAENDITTHIDTLRVLSGLATVFQASRRVSIEGFCNSLNVDIKDMLPMLVEYSDDLGYVIDGKYLELKDIAMASFVAQLDAYFGEWSSKEKTKHGKME